MNKAREPEVMAAIGELARVRDRIKEIQQKLLGGGVPIHVHMCAELLKVFDEAEPRTTAELRRDP